MRDPGSSTRTTSSGTRTTVPFAATLLMTALLGGSSCSEGGGGAADTGNLGTAGAAGSPGGASGGGAGGVAGRGGASPVSPGSGSGGAGGTSGGPGPGPMGGPRDGGPSADPDGSVPQNGAAADGGQDAGGSPAVPPAPPSPWTELSAPAIAVQGGAAVSAGGQGQPGGTVHLFSRQDIVLDAGRADTPLPMPAAPAVARILTSGELVANVTVTGGARVLDATSGGIDPVRTIEVSSGDLLIEGSLRAADLGAARQGLTLSAPAGTVYVTGAVDTSGAAGTGQAGGPITVVAQRVVITGRLSSSGGDGASAAGAGGAITIRTSQTLTLTGGIDTLGGDARGPAAVVGGNAGALAVQAGGDVVLTGRIRLRGGAAISLGADAQGGAAAALRMGSDGTIQLGGIVDGRGGLASAAAAGGKVAGGTAGALLVGQGGDATPTAITIVSAVQATGGEGSAVGGKGGDFKAEPDTGNVIVAGAGALDVSGASAAAAPGLGGAVFISGRSESGSGDVTVQGDIVANGGHVVKPGAGPGAAGGRIEFRLTPVEGGITLAPAGKLSVVGGRAGGPALAGGGGSVSLITNDGDLTVAGTISAMGGEAPDPGGTGGPGGSVHLWSDRNGNADDVESGNLLVAPSGLVDASGGNGSIGGSARNDGISYSVAEFPDDQDKIAILVDCDNVDGDTETWLDNQGRLVARGGAPNGNGGDVMFHGIMPDGEEPVPGNLDNKGSGSGKAGDFGSE